MTALILASGSPRRADIMAKIVDEFEIVVPDIDESIKNLETPSEHVIRLAIKKARVVYEAAGGKSSVLAADTVVVHNRILGKPIDEKDAERMLKELADDEHTVITGVAIINAANNKMTTFHETTHVFFGSISEKEIKEYIKTGEPMDKAGAYGIQGAGGKYITKIEGCFYNVMGFPLNKIYTALTQSGII